MPSRFVRYAGLRRSLPVAALALIAALALFTACGDSPQKAERRRQAAEKIEPLIVEVGGIVEELIASDFPELEGIRLAYKPILSPDVFLATDVEAGTIFEEPLDRDYVLYINAYLVDHHPGSRALRGIMAHELVHFSDYLSMNAWDLIVLYFQSNYNDDFNVGFERDTDVEAMRRGYAAGIRAYRVWIYEQLDDPAQLAKKKRRYFSPAEIDAWLAEQEERRPPEK